MNQEEIEALLIKVVNAIQKQSGRADAVVSEETRPVVDIEGFDSLNGVEATVDVIDQLELELEFNNVFVEDGEALTIHQAAKRIGKCANKKGNK